MFTREEIQELWQRAANSAIIIEHGEDWVNVHEDLMVNLRRLDLLLSKMGLVDGIQDKIRREIEVAEEYRKKNIGNINWEPYYFGRMMALQELYQWIKYRKEVDWKNIEL